MTTTRLLCLLSTLFLLTLQAHADKALAREHFKKGLSAYHLENYDKAIEEFRTAFEAEPDPVFLYNIAQAYRLSGRPEEAIKHYQKYLKLSPDAPHREDVEARIAELKKSLAPPSKTPSPAISENSPARESRHADAEQASPRHPTIDKPPPPAVVSPPVSPDKAAAQALTTPTPPKDSKPRRWPIWVGVATGVAAAGLGVGLGVGITQSRPEVLPVQSAR
jgi:tetratricopeptide (TPR) repeat protein